MYLRKQSCLLEKVVRPEVSDCTDVKCSNQMHREQIEVWCKELVRCCLKADDHLPRVRKKKVQKPYWTEEVKPFKDECIWWHQVWKQNGEQRDGILYEQKTAAKKQYMYAVRRYKRREESLRRQKMADAICENNTRDFFREIRKVKSKRASAPSIDGIVDTQEIAQHFAEKYKTLFNSVPSNSSRMNDIIEYVDENCQHCSEDDKVIKQSAITQGLLDLKAHKGDGNIGLISTHLLMSGEQFKSHLAKLMTAIMTHGYHPQMLLVATITSIPKDNRSSICDSSNYRGISLCSSLSKLLDIIVLQKYKHLLQTSDMQYAYKKKHSTAICTLTVKEVINYYIKKDSEVYSCCVDATKAFDRVQHDRLFEILIQRKVPAIVIRLMMDMYKRQEMRTVWCGQISDTFNTINGVRQGGIISPALFCVFMDELLNGLQSAGDGCWIDNNYFGAVGYADDLMLLSPSITGLRRMIQICESFGGQYGVQFNAKKTVCILFSRKKVDFKPVIKLCGATLQWVDHVKHLGSVLTCSLDESVDIRRKKGDLVQRVNTTLATLDGSHDSILRKVFNSQCAHLYGTTSWNFTDKAFKDYVVTWNRCVRRLFQLPPMTHTRYLPHLVGSASVTDQIYSRFLKMLNNMKNSENIRVRKLFERCWGMPTSIMNVNISLIQKRIGTSVENVLLDGAMYLKKAYVIEGAAEDVLVSNMILELRSVITGKQFLHDFDNDDVKEFLILLCII